MIKILFASDFHLGFKDTKLPIPEDFRLATFKRVSFLAKSHDILLIAGDLFDNANIDGEIIDIVKSEFRKIQDNGVKIICTTGENELNEHGDPLSFISNLNVTHLFLDSEGFNPYSFTKDNQKIFIYGLSAFNKADITRIKRINEDGFHIGLFHADFQFRGDSKDRSVRRLRKKDIKSLDLDFYALGHHHQFRLFKSLGRIIGAYPGSPEATSFNESGDRYVLSMVIKENEIYQIKRLTVNSAMLKETVIDCTELSDSNTILEELNNNASSQAIHKMILKGKRDFMLDYHAIDGFNKDYYKLYFEDQSIPSIDVLIDEFNKEETLRGEFFSILKERKKIGVPVEIDMMRLSDILNQIIKTGLYSTEEFLCKYKNA